eukprot:Opistho-2@61493
MLRMRSLIGAAESLLRPALASYSTSVNVHPSSNAETAPKLQDRDLFRNKAYIDGKWVDADSGASFPVYNPANGAHIGHVPEMGATETRRAIEAAEKAFHKWSKTTAKDRSIILRKWFDLLMRHQEDLALLMTVEQGKPMKESRGEIAYGASYIEYYAEEAKRIRGDIVPHGSHGRRLLVLKQPVGVTAMITPWNFPSAMIARKVAAAFAAGCTAVIKPAEDTPYSALALCELAHRAGIPDGVINVVTCSRPRADEVGTELATHPTVRKLSFTGSTAVGKHLMSLCSSTVKKVSLELGGNAPFIVFDDADLDKAVEGAVASKFRNSGQTCVCANRMFVQSKIHDEFVRKFSDAVRAIRVGDGTVDGIGQGPMINSRAVEKTEQFVGDAVQKGAKVVVGGRRHALGGNFFEPTVLTNVHENMLVCSSEIFGPLAPVHRFETEEEAIRMANNTRAGLMGYVYTRDLGRAWRMAEALEFGMIGLNEGIISSEAVPFGGWKESGLGREGSQYGLDDYLEYKYVCMAGIGA